MLKTILSKLNENPVRCQLIRIALYGCTEHINIITNHINLHYSIIIKWKLCVTILNYYTLYVTV